MPSPLAFLSAATRTVWIGLCLLALAACTGGVGETLQVSPITTNDRYAAIVIDADSGKVLYEANADALRYPASLTKMMTIYLVFDALKSGQLSRASEIPVSEYAASRPASKLYLKAGSTIPVDTAIRSLVVKSANDVATAVAEHLAGSEEEFARRMTAKARSLGMTSTVFTNASGLPNSKMRSTARDMARLSMAIKRNHARYYGYFGLTSFDYNGKKISGHNQVLASYAGADGLKTGYTRAAGFNLATSARRNGRSVIAVVMGANSSKGRNARMVELLDAAFSSRR